MRQKRRLPTGVKTMLNQIDQGWEHHINCIKAHRGEGLVALLMDSVHPEDMPLIIKAFNEYLAWWNGTEDMAHLS